MHKKQFKCIKKCKFCGKILQISCFKKGVLTFTSVYYIKRPQLIIYICLICS